MRGINIENKKIKYIILVYLALSIGIIIYVVNGMICRDYENISQKTIIDKGWDITVNGVSYNDVDITKFEFPELLIGDKIVLSVKVPTIWHYNLPGLTMYIRQSAIRVYIDDELIHEYGYDRIEQGKSLGCGYQLVDFSEEYKGKTMTIEMEIGEKFPFKMMNAVYISESRNVIKQIVVDNRLPLIIGAFLVVLGIVLCVITMFAMIISKKYMRILLLAGFSMSVGMWILCYYDLMNIFAMPVYTASLMEYMSLFLMPVPLTAYMFWQTKALNSKKVMRVYYVAFAIQFILSATVITLHTLDIVHGAASLQYFQMYLVVWVILSIYVIFKNVRANVGHTRIFFIGLIFVAVCIMSDLANYVSERYIGQPLFAIRGIFSLGILIFLVVVLIDLYYNAVTHMIEDKEKQLLIDRAYTDALTGLNNHRYCAEFMEKLDENKSKEYVIISIDLNDLKKINDKFGHLKGDRLIKGTAEILNKVFSDYGIVGRLGGDEFIVIMDECDKELIDSLLVTLNNLTTENNISMAYGYAIATEVDNCTTAKVYQLADERMYKHKKAIKSTKQ